MIHTVAEDDFFDFGKNSIGCIQDRFFKRSTAGKVTLDRTPWPYLDFG